MDLHLRLAGAPQVQSLELLDYVATVIDRADVRIELVEVGHPEPRSSLLVMPTQTWPRKSFPVAPQMAQAPQESGGVSTRTVG